MGNATRGLKLGRRVDAAFKDWCKTGSIPPNQPPGVSRRLATICAALAKHNVKMTDSNIFVKRGDLRTHIDGVGTHTPTNTDVVVELKCTQATHKNHVAAYDVACAALPSVTVAGTALPNTERTRHMLQLSFCLLATGAKRGYVVVSTSDGAAVYPLHHSAPPAIFDIAPVPRIAPPPSGRRPRRCRSPLSGWPGAKVAAPGWEQLRKVGRRGALLARHSDTVYACATKTMSGAAIAAARAAAKSSDASVQHALLCFPARGAWSARRIRL